jgi:hypothetical protein
MICHSTGALVVSTAEKDQNNADTRICFFLILFCRAFTNAMEALNGMSL